MSRIIQGPLRRALIVENPNAVLDELLLQGGFEQVTRVAESPEPARLIELLQQTRAQVLFKRSRVQVTDAVLAACPELVSIQLCSIGDDSVDKAAAAARGVLVFNDPVSNGRSVVELAVGHLIALSRRLYETCPQTLAGDWEKSNRERYEIQGKVLGLVGLGNIGRAVARACSALGMHIRFYDNRRVAQEVGQEMGWESAESLESLFRGSDAVSLHTSAFDHQGHDNTGSISRELLFQLGADRPESSPRLLLNLARGNLLAPQDLLDAVQNGPIRRAAVDVYPDEPRANGPGWACPYAAEPRIAATPHIGAATQEAQPRIARRVAQTTLGFSTACELRDCTFSPRTTISMRDDLRPGRALLMVLHSTVRGTKKALDEAVYEAGADNLRSQHRDFADWGLAVEVILLDRPLDQAALASIEERTAQVTGDPRAVRRIRQVLAG